MHYLVQCLYIILCALYIARSKSSYILIYEQYSASSIVNGHLVFKILWLSRRTFFIDYQQLTMTASFMNCNIWRSCFNVNGHIVTFNNCHSLIISMKNTEVWHFYASLLNRIHQGMNRKWFVFYHKYGSRHALPWAPYFLLVSNILFLTQ